MRPARAEQSASPSQDRIFDSERTQLMPDHQWTASGFHLGGVAASLDAQMSILQNCKGYRKGTSLTISRVYSFRNAT